MSRPVMYSSIKIKALLNILLIAGWLVLQYFNSKINKAASGDLILLFATIALWFAKNPQTSKQKTFLILAYCSAFICYLLIYLAGRYGI